MSWHLDVEHVAGIRRGSATLEPGLNAVRASNWQGKSSFLAAIATVLGTASPLTEGATEGRVSLSTDDGEYAVELTRDGRNVRTTGEPYLSAEADRVCADLFAFLGEENEIRRAVREGDDLEPLLTRPLDFEDIDANIAEARRERDRVDEALSEAEDAADRLPTLAGRVSELEAEVEELEAKRAAADAAGGDETREALSDARAERSRVQSRIDRLESTAERVREQLDARNEELDGLDVEDDEELARELDAAKRELNRQERDIELLRGVYDANRRVVAEDRTELLTDVTHGVVDDELACWVCGAETDASSVTERLDDLAERIERRTTAAEASRERVEELTERVESREKRRRRERELQTELRELRERRSDLERRLDDARERDAELAERIDDLREQIESDSEQITDIESELKYANARLDDAKSELESAESEAEKLESLRSQRQSLTEEITRLRRRKQEIKKETRDAFDDAIREIVPLFETGFESARLTSEFDLVVARDGREASLGALSEGEVELLGLATALAGYQAFDVAERVPVMLVDRLGGIADENLGRLTEYLSGTATYLVMTAYPEHSAVEGNDIDPSEWSVVSDSAATRGAE
ncbi:archaea-specific SMC-related protein [Haloferax volcanii]|uniref:SMC-like protein Sph1 n=3 Tax=Haloferax volcanii TaxID=2246 RepID=A0A384KBN8_HALVD|nr:archaea-specific SMC-related protein [Haloferax volcanii]ADE02059.1 Smc-like protein Sph1 [Haloferax volcanii DS2]ELY32073.1 SMC-like protein Sph1 [Haloferax volcanii DS2]MBS8120536.1 ATPase [Haloferax volcanii]MBS8125573.1 ATPase [Haloferax volcanii]MBS8129440.1 ATPase [Haloferax volcanii]